MTTSLQLRNIQKWFGHGASRVIALRGIDLDLQAGSFTIVRGPSGSGKSSLLAACGGLQAPDAGIVRADGDDIWSSASRTLKFRRESCGYVFQSHNLLPALSAAQQIEVPLRMTGIASREAKSRAMQALESVGLLDRSQSRPDEMSGGQNQRVAIARMLARNPRYMFCDEPTSALDRANGQRVAELLRDAARTRNVLIMCMTHDERLLHYCDRTIVLEDGCVVQDGGGDG